MQHGVNEIIQASKQPYVDSSPSPLDIDSAALTAGLPFGHLCYLDLHNDIHNIIIQKTSL